MENGKYFLPQKTIRQPAVYRYHVTGSLRQPLGNEREDCFGLIFRFDWSLRQRALCIKRRQFVSQLFSVLFFTERYSVLRQRSDHAITRKHRAALDDRS